MALHCVGEEVVFFVSTYVGHSSEAQCRSLRQIPMYKIITWDRGAGAGAGAGGVVI